MKIYGLIFNMPECFFLNIYKDDAITENDSFNTFSKMLKIHCMFLNLF